MENKLKELTDRLYGEGLEKGRVEADRLVAEAKEKAPTAARRRWRCCEAACPPGSARLLSPDCVY